VYNVSWRPVFFNCPLISGLENEILYRFGLLFPIYIYICNKEFDKNE